MSDAFEVHRRSSLFAVVGVVALLLAAGLGWVCYDRRDVVSGVLAGLLLIVALWLFSCLRDYGAPLLVADEHGLRLHGDDGWVGLLWSEIDRIDVDERRFLRGPRITVDAMDTPEGYVVPLGLVTDTDARTAAAGLAPRRAAASY